MNFDWENVANEDDAVVPYANLVRNCPYEMDKVDTILGKKFGQTGLLNIKISAAQDIKKKNKPVTMYMNSAVSTEANPVAICLPDEPIDPSAMKLLESMRNRTQ